MIKIADIVVTYNRKKLLRENLEALINQTYKNHKIFVIDNNSTDGTEEMVRSLNSDFIVYYNTNKNLGGAGGFSFGLEKAVENGYDFAWIMDDDAIPDEKALESLVNKSKQIDYNFSFLASLVYWTDNKLFEMNVPSFKYKNKNDAKIDLISKYKLMPIDEASFVGCFVNIECVKKVGLPIADFFIYGDDVEFTQRMKKEKNAYLDLDSIIIHKAPSNKGADIITCDKERIQRFYYQSRNGMYIARKNHKLLGRFKLIFKRFMGIIMKAPNYKLKRIYVLLKGTLKGIFYNPKIKTFKKGTEENEEIY